MPKYTQQLTERIKKYGSYLTEKEYLDRNVFFMSPAHEASNHAGIDVNTIVGMLKTDPNDIELVMILAEHANNALLVHIAESLAEREETLPIIPAVFSPMISRILDMNPLIQRIVFMGNQKTVRNAISGENMRVHSDAYNDSHLNKGAFGVARLIHQIHLKAQSLRAKNETKAANTAETLYEKLNLSHKTYVSSDNKIKALDAFKVEAKQHIDAARKELERHRGWKNVIANLLIHIGLLMTTAGVGNVVALGLAYSQGNQNLLFKLIWST